MNSTESLLLHLKRPQIAVDGIGIKNILSDSTQTVVLDGECLNAVPISEHTFYLHICQVVVVEPEGEFNVINIVTSTWTDGVFNSLETQLHQLLERGQAPRRQ